MILVLTSEYETLIISVMVVKILALHGYTQSGPGFQRKIHKLQSHLGSIFPGLQICFPTGVVRLRPSEIALGGSSRLSEPPVSDGNRCPDHEPDPDEIDAYAWHTLHDTRDLPIGFVDSLDALADILRNEGPFDGILGFSQGAVLAVMVASLLEGEPRKKAFKRALEEFPESFPYPLSFEMLEHPPLKFGITYGAMMGRGKIFTAFYNHPIIQTPFIHFCGCWDPVVGIEMARAVEDAQIGGDRCIRIIHPGAHNVPLGVKYLNAVSDFIEDHFLGSKGPEPTRPVLEQQLTLRLPLQFVDTSIKRLRSDSTSSVSDESGFSNTSNQTRQRRIKVRHLLRYKTVRISRQAFLGGPFANSCEKITVELQIFPSSNEPIYLSSSTDAIDLKPI